MLETEEPPGLGPPMHVHHDCAEAFYDFDDLASALQRAGVTEDELTEVASAHAMEIVGPPSDSYL